MKNLTATEISQLLANLGNEGYSIKRRIRREAPLKEIIAALENSINPDMKEILCDILGELHAKMAVPALISCLDDPSPGVRSSAADALAKIGSPRAGEALLRRFSGEETEDEVRRMIALALGAVGYQPAIPKLIEALADPDSSLRGSVAWSLGALRANEAIDVLQQVLASETNPYAVARIQESLEAIKGYTAQSNIK